MKSIKSIYKIGTGPSSSHSMGPRKAAKIFKNKIASASIKYIEVELYGSLSATGKGHLTDKAIIQGSSPFDCKVVFKSPKTTVKRPNTMIFKAFSPQREMLYEWEVYSIGGGNLIDENGMVYDSYIDCYPHNDISSIIQYCQQNNMDFSKYVIINEGDEIIEYLEDVWQTMQDSIQRGLNNAEEFLPGGLNLRRKSASILKNSNGSDNITMNLGTLISYSLAVAEENAAGGRIVTAPTCGSSGVLPSILKYAKDFLGIPDNEIIKALSTAGMFGNIVSTNASISGAEVGCQGEIGTASAMAAAAITQLKGGSISQIEYAAEMALEHFLGLTCDPIDGIVQIPCIERNAFAAMRAIDCSCYALLTDGNHVVSFDQVVKVMAQTGRDMQSGYRETALAGLAKI